MVFWQVKDDIRIVYYVPSAYANFINYGFYNYLLFQLEQAFTPEHTPGR